jgi:hypothetical protein
VHKIRTLRETKKEEHIKYREKTTEYKYQIEESGTQQQQQQQKPGMRTSQSESGLVQSAAASNNNNKRRRPSMTGSTVEALSGLALVNENILVGEKFYKKFSRLKY